MLCKPKFTTCLRISIVLIFSIASCAFFLWFAYSGSLIWFLDWVASIGLWGNLLFIVSLTLTGLPFALGGYTPLGLAAGFIYGVVDASITVTIGTMLGSSLGFWVTRTLMKSWFRALVDSRPALQAFMKTMESHGFKLVLIMRMAPIPFGVQNGLFSISEMTFGSFTLATFLGLLPEVIMLVYMGTTMRDLAEIASGDFHFGPWQQAMLGIEIGVSVILGIILVWVSRQAMNQVKKNQPGGLGAELGDNGDSSPLLALDELNFSVQVGGGGESDGGELELGLVAKVGGVTKKKKSVSRIGGNGGIVGGGVGGGDGVSGSEKEEGTVVVSPREGEKTPKGAHRAKKKAAWD